VVQIEKEIQSNSTVLLRVSQQAKMRHGRSVLCCTVWGEEADDILSSTNISNGDRVNYSSVMGKFDEYFKCNF